MNIEYIIVQAGGEGTRMGALTKNKPKALVPVENKPILFHLFDKFPDKKFIIIADYKKNMLKEYLECFFDAEYIVADTEGTGTCAGLNKSLSFIPDDKAFMIIWSDLILPDAFTLPSKKGNYIGISQSFPCRWKYQNGNFSENSSTDHGVAGLFIFHDKSFLDGLPESGEFVRWLQNNDMHFGEVGLAGAREFGLLSDFNKLEQEKCRPFNKITTDGDVLVKESVDSQGENLARSEREWYIAAIEKGVTAIPRIYSCNPLRMERIEGKCIYEYSGLTYNDKRDILKKVADALKGLHDLERIKADAFSVKQAYYTKTMERISKVRDLIPLADRKTLVINGRECKNIYFCKRELEQKLGSISCKSFAFIHGDCTFSNIMLKNDTEPVFIDPRGYFGHTGLYGDPNYDWAKLYYSIMGNYDRFNLKDFQLDISGNEVELTIKSNNWEDMQQDFFIMSGSDPEIINLLHAVIWLSLTTYAWHNYDSVCGAFYHGLYCLAEVL